MCVCARKNDRIEMFSFKMKPRQSYPLFHPYILCLTYAVHTHTHSPHESSKLMYLREKKCILSDASKNRWIVRQEKFKKKKEEENCNCRAKEREKKKHTQRIKYPKQTTSNRKSKCKKKRETPAA